MQSKLIKHRIIKMPFIFILLIGIALFTTGCSNTGVDDEDDVWVFTLSEETSEVEVGKSITITTLVDIVGFSEDDVAWESEDPDIATVVDGVITGVKKGTVKIVARVSDKVKKVTITVKEAPVVKLGELGTALVAENFLNVEYDMIIDVVSDEGEVTMNSKLLIDGNKILYTTDMLPGFQSYSLIEGNVIYSAIGMDDSDIFGWMIDSEDFNGIYDELEIEDVKETQFKKNSNGYYELMDEYKTDLQEFIELQKLYGDNASFEYSYLIKVENQKVTNMDIEFSFVINEESFYTRTQITFKNYGKAAVTIPDIVTQAINAYKADQ